MRKELVLATTLFFQSHPYDQGKGKTREQKITDTKNDIYTSFVRSSTYVRDNAKDTINTGREILSKAITKINGEEDFPLYIDYGEEDPGLPKILDIKWDKSRPEYLFIRLDNRLFAIEPMLGTISDVVIKKGGFITIEIGYFEKDFSPSKLTELILKLHSYTGGVGSRFSMKGVYVRELVKKHQ